MTDAATEALIQAKGLTAPRVTPEVVAQTIVAEYYTTADKAFAGAPIIDGLELLTICVLRLRNGFTVVGSSACASPENFDAEVGQRAARVKAVEQIFALEGYLLRQRLHDAAAAAIDGT